jgi:hypothetical protein
MAMEAASDTLVSRLKRLLPLTRTQFFALLLIGYLASYAYLRHSRTFIRIENKGGAQRNLILAPSDPWDSMLWGMSEEAPLLMPLGAYALVKKPALNGMYWPLRKVESLFWTWTGR